MAETLPLESMYRGRTLDVGHRGASAYAPENTLKSFLLAMAQGADGIELDVWLSSDGVPVVIHDEDPARTTNGTGDVTLMTLEAIQAFDAGQGERIPTLDEVFTALPDTAFVNVELKHKWDDIDESVGPAVQDVGNALERTVLDVLEKHGAIPRVIVSSFNPFSLIAMRELSKDIALGYLSQAGSDFSSVLAGIEFQALHPEHPDVTAEYMAQARARGKRVNVWTVNDAARMAELRDLGVDGIISNHPDIVRRVLDQGKR